MDEPGIYSRDVDSYDELVQNLGRAHEQAKAYGRLEQAEEAFKSGVSTLTLDLEYSFDMYHCVQPSLASLGWKDVSPKIG